MPNSIMDGVDINDALKSHTENGQKAAKERYTATLAGAVAALQRVATRVASRHDDDVDGANAASDALENISSALMRTGDLPSASTASAQALPSGSDEVIDTHADDLERRLSDLQGRYDDAQGDLGDVTRERDNLKHELDEAARKLDQAQRENRDAKAELSKAALDITDAKAKLTKAETERDRYKNEAKDKSNLQTQLDETKAKLTIANRDLGTASSENVKLRKDLSDANGKVDTTAKELRDEKAKNAQLNSELAAAKATPASPTPPPAPADSDEEESDDDSTDSDGTPPAEDTTPTRRRVRDFLPGHKNGGNR